MLASDKVKLELRNANKMKCVMRYYNEKKYNLWNSYENQEFRYQNKIAKFIMVFYKLALISTKWLILLL